MKALKGANNRTHFRLDMEKKTIDLNIKVNDKENIIGSIKDVSNGGLSFTLSETPRYTLVDKEVEVTFVIEGKPFLFNMLVLRRIHEGSCVYFAGQFIEESKIKKSQLSLLLMKLKLTTEHTNAQKES